MIKNERQYRITKAQIADLSESLDAVTNQPIDSPQLQAAEAESLRGVLAEMRAQVEEYEALIAGERPVLTLESFDELPHALIKARIASGLSQKDLAERLGLKEQQIQRYEATDYASASLDRLQEVVRALDIQIREEIILPKTKLSFDRLLIRLRRAGLGENFVVERLIPRALRARLEDVQDPGDPNTLVLQVASAIGRVFAWKPAEIFGSGQLQLNLGVIGTTRYKTARRVDKEKTSAYTVYAHYLALLVLEATPSLATRPIPTDPHILREAIMAAYGSLTFEHTLRYVWSLGIPVLPLADAGAFHGACWRVEGRNIIVLKQSVRTPARWLFDLLHELKHAADDPEQPDYTVIEGNEQAPERVRSEAEQDASRFSGNVLLQSRAEELADRCVTAADGSVEHLKRVVPQVAQEAGVRSDALANYMAFRLSLQGIDWWATANNLQAKQIDPWTIARDVLLEYLSLGVLNEADRGLLLQAVAEAV